MQDRTMTAVETIKAAFQPFNIGFSPDSAPGRYIYQIRWQAASEPVDHTDETLIDVANDPATQMKLGAGWRRV